jgi:cytochrome P450
VVTQQPQRTGYRPLFNAQDDVAADPRTAYERLRSSPPVHEGAVVVSARHEVQEVLHNPDVFSSAGAFRLPTGRPLSPLELTPATHELLRAALDPLLSPTKVVELNKMISYVAGELIDGLVGEEEIDFAAEFSVPFPAQVLTTILGLPMDDLGWLLDLKEGVMRPNRTLGKPLMDPEVLAYQNNMISDVYEYFGDALDEREQNRTDDLLSDLLDVRIGGEPLDRDQLLDICICLLLEGIDPMSAALDTFFACLAESPELRAKIIANPRSGLEELLRWETPVMFVTRTAATEASLGGCPISAGQRVYALLGSANLDPEEFGDADKVCPHREINRHMAFGSGIHRCFGSHLARMQLSVALKEWHTRIPNYLVSRRTKLTFTPGVRTVERFPMRLGPVR